MLKHMLAGLERLNLKPRQAHALLQIVAEPGRSTRPIAVAIGISNPAATRACQRLATLGFITNTVDSQDLRRVILNPTEAGIAAIRSLEAKA